MARTIFVTGIGTDVGKTVVSAILTEALQADYWKPVQSGSYYGTDTEKVKKLVSNEKTVFFPEAYNLEAYMSPHAAAITAGTTIDFDSIKLPETNNTLIIEGAGGLLVPLTSKHFMIDLIKKFESEVILVVQNYLGSINHTLLSVEALKARNIKILGLVFNGPPQPMNEELILAHSGVKLVGHVHKEATMSRDVIQKYTREFKNI